MGDSWMLQSWLGQLIRAIEWHETGQICTGSTLINAAYLPSQSS